MAFIPFTNSVEIVIRFTLLGWPVAIVIGGVNGGGVSVANMTTLAGAIDTWRKTYIQPSTNAELVATTVDVYDLTSASSPVVVLPATATLAGAGTGDVPAASAQVITHLTALRGRSYRGRTFMPGLDHAAVANTQAWSAASLITWATAFGALPAAMAGAGYGHVVLSRRANNAPRTTGVSTIVTGYRTTTKIEQQRRRSAS